MKLRRLMIPLAAVLAATAPLSPPIKPEEGVALTIYNQNFGVVRERRKVNVRREDRHDAIFRRGVAD